MPLTPEEQQELAQLQTKYAPKQQGGLSPAEQAELAQLHQKFGGQSAQQPKSYVRLPQDIGYTPGGQPASVAEADPEGNARNAKLGLGLAVGGAGGVLTEGLSGLSGVAARAGANAAGGGLQKYLSNLIDKKDNSTQGVIGNAVLGGGISLGSDALSSLLRGAANSSMLRAVGLTGAKSKNVPSDLGNRMVDEGIWGTKAGMAKQVASKYANAENQIQELASGLEGNVGGDTLAKAIEEKSKQYLNPEDASKIVSGREGGVSAFSKVSDAVRKGAAGYQEGSPEVTSVRNMVGEGGDLTPISSQTTPAVPGQEGTYGGKGLLALKRAGDSEAFNQSGQMGNTYLADAYRAQADEARNSLAGLSDGAMPEALKREQTLLYANKGLMQPTMVAKNPVSLTDIGSAMVGSASGGLPGAGTATLASKAAISPLVQSLFAKGSQASSKLATQVAYPELLQSLFGAANASSSNAK